MDWEKAYAFILTLTAVDYAVIVVNLLLIAFARPLLKRYTAENVSEAAFTFRVNLLRGLNLVILLVYSYEDFYKPVAENSGGVKFLGTILIFYLCYLSNFLSQHYIQKLYGKARVINDKTIYIETYQTRLLSILAAIFITIIGIISIVKQLGFDSLLEAGGVLGFIGVMLALTQGAWAPDIISGLIFLNSTQFEEGDIVEIDNGIIGRVYKTKLFHTEILNLTNNHRIMIRNSKLRDNVIHNLSKFASPKGLRECLSFNIGYDVAIKDVKHLLSTAYQRAIDQKIPLEGQHDPDIKLLETGDHAVTWGILFYVKSVDKIVPIRRDFREIILATSIEMDISLATPLTHVFKGELMGNNGQVTGDR